MKANRILPEVGTRGGAAMIELTGVSQTFDGWQGRVEGPTGGGAVAVR